MVRVLFVLSVFAAAVLAAPAPQLGGLGGLLGGLGGIIPGMGSTGNNGGSSPKNGAGATSNGDPLDGVTDALGKGAPNVNGIPLGSLPL
ncbi:hypothetical protein AURDEDRAFT_176926 [Auricularia subglabra TFB-10046 SS5]|uniref:Uncharacterized protein n=1 Tax=Auricularia subglabra (strain TFB-10046 / SS5) TaxID=717982 RepID=J0WNR6_AURST|nr:hypothetical protein AURDEDRAFT_176926 [Auricularia subglabra TFB-10046 SS5]